MNICANSWHIATFFEVLGVCGSIVANVLSSPAAQERVLNTWAVRSVEVDDAFVNALFFDEVQGETRVIVSAMVNMVLIFLICLNSREMWFDTGRCNQNTEKVDQCHVHEHIILRVDHLESRIM